MVKVIEEEFYHLMQAELEKASLSKE